MPFLPLDIPPGIVRGGTEYASRNHWYNANLTRWHFPGGTVGPIGGWAAISTSAVTGTARAIIAWRDDSGSRWVMIGTHSHLYVMNSAGALFDVTPVAFTTGRSDAAAATGYGYGPYGSYTYGTARPDTGNYLDATVWDLDTFGQYAIGCSPDDGKIYEWTLSTGTPAAALAGAPTSCKGVVVTKQRFIVALGAGGNSRKLQWADQESGTDWSPSATNQAGDLDLYAGVLKCGCVVGDQTLVLTDLDAHVMDYIGLPFVYSVKKVGDGCGANSKRCVVSTGQFAVWWGLSGFFIYDGSFRPLPCDVWDYLQINLRQSQRSKISGWHNVVFSEIWWEWPNGSSENRSYVFWNYRENIWGLNDGARTRYCGVGPGVYSIPFLMSSDGYVYQHEYGFSYSGNDPSMRSGPIELGNGDNVMHVLGIIPDLATTPDLEINFFTRQYPNADETETATATFDSTGITDLRFTARQVEILLTGPTTFREWRWGRARLDVRPGGKR